MAALGELVVSLSANTAKFTEGLNKAEYQSQKAFDNMKKSAIAYGAAVGTVAVAAVTAFAYSIKKAIDAADEMSKASQKVGVTTEALSQLKYAADLSGVSFEGLQNGLKKLSVNLYEASNGTITQVETFKALGLSVADSSGKLKSADSVLEEIADIFQRMPDGVKKTALAVETFGKAGADLIPMLNGGADGIRKLRDEADMLGLTIDKSMAIDAEKFNDSIAKLSASYDGFAMRTGNILLPALNSIIDTIDDAVFGFDKLERAIIKQKGTDIGDWKPTPMISDKPKEGEFNFGEYGLQKEIELTKEQEAAAKKAAKALADARKKAAEEANAAEVRRINVAIWVNEQIVALEKSKNEDITAANNKRIDIEQQRANENFAEAQRIASETTNEWQEAFEELKNSVDGYSRDMSRSLAQFALGGKASFADMIDSMLLKLLEFANQKLIFDPLFKSLTKTVDNNGGLDGLLGSIAGGITGLFNGGVSSSAGAYSIDQNPYLNFDGFRANGGSVSAGRNYIVGERGAEMFVPSSNGSIVSNSQMGGGNNVVVNVIEAQGTKANVQQQQNPDGTMSISVIVEQLYGVMNRDLQKGSGIAPTLERRYGLNRLAGA